MHPSEPVRQRLGLQILFDFSSIIDAIGFCSDNGLRVLELNLGNIEFQRQLAHARERRRIRAAALRQEVALAIHAIDGPSFFIPSVSVRAAGIRQLKQELDWAHGVGAKNVVMHLGFDMNFGMDGGARYTHREFPEYYTRALTESLAELKAYARGESRLCVENVGGFRYDLTPPILDRLIGGNLGLCLDVGHINTLKPDVRAKELAFFRKHRAHIFHSHVHDNSGLRDEHSALGRGRIDFVPFFKLLEKTDALVVFEVRPKESALESLRYFEKEIEPRLGR
ncbi:sugar phosphate isomerase/epimerase [candidate division WOR-3 bacterium]|uniref:Sugar phosphate isomerase/epimerase n=1 Tax=candidate division WOR-3 bacterium TaxID=2052148 RepID=A0A937XDB1_UNCW3|nr:sugar phosphate isomerase/epimerase [candidate division WOR-3 bacterium]